LADLPTVQDIFTKAAEGFVQFVDSLNFQLDHDATIQDRFGEAGVVSRTGASPTRVRQILSTISSRIAEPGL
jgi:hypothetical protein